MNIRFIALLAVSLLLTGVACSKSSDQGDRKINVYMWSEYIDPAIPEQFKAATGIDMHIDVYEDTETMEAKMQHSGGSGQYDVLVVSDHVVDRLARQKLIRPLPQAEIPNSRNVTARFRNPPYDPHGEYSLPYQWGTMGIMYRKDKVPQIEHSWSSILDPAKQPGPVLLIDSMRDMMAVALKLHGCSVNSRNAEELKSAAETLLQAKKSPHCIGFEGGVGGKNKVLAGDAVAAVVYNGDAMRGLEEADDKVGFFIPREGTIIWVDAMVITAGSKHPKEAAAFINYILDPAVSARLAHFNRYPTPNEAAMPLINPQDRENPAIYPPADLIARMEYLEDLGDDSRLYDELWTAVKSR